MDFGQLRINSKMTKILIIDEHNKEMKRSIGLLAWL